ncbi:potassium transporter TrkH [Cellulophaga sp. HaHaR_3_176]|uniref:TrkH family potassium uptake protein n=1 Tax=Cellulophaga sp. HaHaR_3_176 TaxID=1942464 RepID=UPI001C1F6795|nr:potassium transporter TrkG [Cellulophaga sp. HaHaR_3_176]QWX82558.1 potassium transporter TrkH [Cellulophaga sp. HaHaR_3_176]
MKNKFLKKFLNSYKKFQVSKSPQLNLVWGFFIYTFIGFILLSLPIFHINSVSIIDNLFTSTSAISTTGLATVSLSESYNIFGQVLIILLVQIGGVGYMTLTTYYLLLTTRRITNWHQKIIGAEFTIPNTLNIVDFLKSAFIFTFIMEFIGAICFYFAFKDSGMESSKAIWYGIFHSTSAFCTAGFGLLNDSFISYQNNNYINAIISILAIAGSLGFIVVTDLWYRISGRSKNISFTTKIIIYGFNLLLFLGTIITYFTEPLVDNKDNALMTSFFQAMTAITTVGFNTTNTGLLSNPILLLLIFLMYIGASPSGTAGGMKVTTLTAVLAVIKSRLLGQKKVTFMKRKIPIDRLYVATSTFILYTCLLFLFSFLLTFTEKDSFENILFEAASALGTVGLSTGLTSNLTLTGKILIIILMFIGRVGVLTFGFALLSKKDHKEIKMIQEDLAV